MSNRTFRLAVVLVALAACAYALEPNMTKEELLKSSTHIVTGEVLAVYEYETMDEESYLVRGYGVVEVLVDGVEKGDGLQAGQVAYFRYWVSKGQRFPEGKMDPSKLVVGGSGQRDLPKAGERSRFYVVRNDKGQFETCSPNGTEKP